VRRIRIPAGRVLGIRLWLHWSWFVVLGLVVYLTTVDFGTFYPRMPVAERPTDDRLLILMGSQRLDRGRIQDDRSPAGHRLRLSEGDNRSVPNQLALH